MTANHNLLPKHGEHLKINSNLIDVKLKHICKLQVDASLTLVQVLDTILINDREELVMFPCKQCVLDIALQFYDLSEALKGLIDGK